MNEYTVPSEYCICNTKLFVHLMGTASQLHWKVCLQV